MGTRLRWSQVLADALAEATEALSTGSPPEPILARRIGVALGADSWSVGRFDARTERAELDVWPGVTDAELMLWATSTMPHSHPVLHHWLMGHCDVAMVSCLVDDVRRWRSSKGYDLLRRGLGFTETGGIRLDAGTKSLHMIGFARHVDFRDQEVSRLQVARPPVVALVSHAAWLQKRAALPDWTSTVLTAAQYGLTARELQVLELLSEGLLASAIARRLQVSVRTVHCHLSHVYDKLGQHDRLSAVLHAHRLGLVRPPPPTSQ